MLLIGAVVVIEGRIVVVVVVAIAGRSFHQTSRLAYDRNAIRYSKPPPDVWEAYGKDREARDKMRASLKGINKK